MAKNDDVDTEANEAAPTEALSINANYNNLVEVMRYKFNFKADKMGNKRDSVELDLLVPSVDGIVAALEKGGKELALVKEAVTAIVLQQAREIVNEKFDITQETFPQDQLSWELIASIEPKARTGGGIPQDQWEAFAEDYIKVMPAATGKTEEQVGLAAKILLSKFTGQYKTNKPVLSKLQEQLGIYLTATPRADDFSDCVEFLVAKADRLLNMSEADLLANL